MANKTLLLQAISIRISIKINSFNLFLLSDSVTCSVLQSRGFNWDGI